MPRKRIKKSKKIAICALFCSLGVVLMYIGAIFEVMDLTTACFASMLCVITLAEIGGMYPWLVYAVTGIISLLILPQKFGALIYLCLAGYYPMLKFFLERIKARALVWILKLLFFNTAMAVMMVLAVFVFITPGMTKWYIIAFFVLGNISFAAFDIALSMLIRLYFVKFRRLLGIDRLLK